MFIIIIESTFTGFTNFLFRVVSLPEDLFRKKQKNGKDEELVVVIRPLKSNL